MNDAGTPGPRGAKASLHELGNPIPVRNSSGPFCHWFGHAYLVEVLKGAAAIGIANAFASARGDQHDAVAFAVFDGNSWKGVGDTGSVRGDGNTEPPCESRVGSGHMQCRCLMSWRNQLDPLRLETGYQAEIRPINDPEYRVDALGRQHPGHDLPTCNVGHTYSGR